MAPVFGGKASTGIVRPLLFAADIAAVLYYHRELEEAVFRKLMAFIIVVTVGILVFRELRKPGKFPTHPLFASTTGIASGFATMIGALLTLARS